jgi:hypothetical protein
MKLTRDVVADLLPVYLSGEASADTCALVEEFLRQDPDLARLAETQRQDLSIQQDLLAATDLRVSPDHELRTLARARAAAVRQRWQMALAMVFTMFPFAFVADDNRLIFFLLRDAPLLAACCWVAAAVLWLLYFWTRHRLRGTGI